MTIFAFMKKMNIKNKYVFSLVIISIMVAFLIHFPELVSLFDVTGQSALFPDMSVLDVANEVFFTFVSQNNMTKFMHLRKPRALSRYTGII